MCARRRVAGMGGKSEGCASKDASSKVGAICWVLVDHTLYWKPSPLVVRFADDLADKSNALAAAVLPNGLGAPLAIDPKAD